MTKLKKAIERVQRGETRAMGFGVAPREKPRALLLGAIVKTSDQANTAIEAGADLAVVLGKSAGDIAGKYKGASDAKYPVGAWVDAADAAGATALKEAGFDFVASPLDATDAGEWNDDFGYVVTVTGDLDDTMLRALGAIGVDGLFVKRPQGTLSVQNQVELARLAMLASAPLLVRIEEDASVDELRALRDAGAAAVLVKEGAAADALKALGDRLREVPPARRKGGLEARVPLLPGAPAHGESEPDDDEDEDDE